MDLELLNMLERASKEDILSIATMTIMYFTKKYGYSYNTTIKLVKDGCKQLEKLEK